MTDENRPDANEEELIEAIEAEEIEGLAEAEVEPESQPRPPAKLERLQKILAARGVASRRKAEEMIEQGRVQVNGKTVTALGTKADAGRDHIRVDGKLLQGAERPRYFVLNKPKGFVTTVKDPEGRPTVMQFFDKMRERLYPVGRLDYMSEGLLLVTNDGELANKLTRGVGGRGEDLPGEGGRDSQRSGAGYSARGRGHREGQTGLRQSADLAGADQAGAAGRQSLVRSGADRRAQSRAAQDVRGSRAFCREDSPRGLWAADSGPGAGAPARAGFAGTGAAAQGGGRKLKTPKAQRDSAAESFRFDAAGEAGFQGARRQAGRWAEGLPAEEGVRNGQTGPQRAGKICRPSGEVWIGAGQVCAGEARGHSGGAAGMEERGSWRTSASAVCCRVRICGTSGEARIWHQAGRGTKLRRQDRRREAVWRQACIGTKLPPQAGVEEAGGRRAAGVQASLRAAGLRRCVGRLPSRLTTTVEESPSSCILSRCRILGGPNGPGMSVAGMNGSGGDRPGFGRTGAGSSGRSGQGRSSGGRPERGRSGPPRPFRSDGGLARPFTTSSGKTAGRRGKAEQQTGQRGRTVVWRGARRGFAAGAQNRHGMETEAELRREVWRRQKQAGRGWRFQAEDWRVFKVWLQRQLWRIGCEALGSAAGRQEARRQAGLNCGGRSLPPACGIRRADIP